jgi:NodT family efflux transporter outer membrane factor (OMF) lipoprotein
MVGLAGCTVGPDYRRPEIALPATYHAPEAVARPGSPTRLDGWWARFGDPELRAAVERALAQNLDLRAAGARIAQSRAAARAAGAALLPKGELQDSASDQELSLLSPFGAVGREVPGFERDYGLYDVGAAASWEVDLFGGLRRTREAARADADAARDEADGVRVAVAAETADTYLQLRACQARLAVARRQEDTEQRLVALLVQRRADGVASDRELRQASAALDGVRATLPPLRACKAAEADRLDVLMGAPAGTGDAGLTAEAPLPSAPSLAGLGTPADLLRRRPDVLAAERRLAAADARIGAALSDYYPKLSITGLLGVESVDANRLFVGDALQHTVSGGLRWRLFDFGRVDAEVAGARGRAAEALAAYRQTVYRATGEVETAVSDLVQSKAEAAALSRQIDQLARARGEAEEAYRGGIVSLIEVLDADRDLLAASDRLASARASADRAAVASFRASGGGWAGA